MTTCPVPFETLVRWWLDDLPQAESAALEEHLFACDTCSTASERLGDLVSGLREWIPPVISHARRDRLAREGKGYADTASRTALPSLPQSSQATGAITGLPNLRAAGLVDPSTLWKQGVGERETMPDAVGRSAMRKIYWRLLPFGCLCMIVC